MKLHKVHVLFIFLWLGIANLYATDPGLKFIENKNQWPEGIDFSARIPGGRMFVSPQGFSFYLLDENRMTDLHEYKHQKTNESTNEHSNEESFIDAHFGKIQLVGASSVKPVTKGKFSEYYNFYLGSNASRWASRAYAYAQVEYPNIYPGIDFKVYSSGQDAKYDYVIHAGADPSTIQVAYSGFDQVCLLDNDLYSITSVGRLVEKKPYAYQIINGVKVEVSSTYILKGTTVSYDFPDGYDSCYDLIIDPLLIFSTYSGSTADNWGSTATPGEHGTLYSAGVTSITYGGKFPATEGAFQISEGGQYDIAILKYDSTGQSLLYASYLGGIESESPHSLVVDKDDNLLVLGTTSSVNFPTTAGAFDNTYNGGTIYNHVIPYNLGSDLFVAKISRDGDVLLNASYLGGSNNDGLNINTSGQLVQNYGDQLRGDIITDDAGAIYISTVTTSSDFPVSNSFGMTYNGGISDALILKLDASISSILWGTYLGGANADASHTIKLDVNGDVVVAGGTTSLNFPTTSGAYQPTNAGRVDGWITRIKSDGSEILHSTLTGTIDYEQIYFLELNSANEVYVYGQTNGTMPITPGVYSNPNSGQFIQKFSPALNALLFSTVFGSGRGVPDISPTAFLVNDCNNIYVSGWGGIVNSQSGFWQNNTLNMPTTFDAYQKTSSGSDFYFMVLTEDASRFLYGTYLGGTNSRTHVDGGTSRFDKGGIVYHAVCSGCAAYNATGGPTSDFPTTGGAWSRTNNSSNCNNAAFKFDLSSLKAILQTNSVALDNPGLRSVCMPDKVVLQNLSIGGEMFEWDLGDGTYITKFDNSPITHQYAGTGNYLVKLRAIDQGTCRSRDSTSATIDVFLASAFVQEDDVICEGADYMLQAGGGVNYFWWDQDSTYTSTLQTPVVTPVDSTHYFVKITDSNGCIKKDTVQIGVIPGFDIDFDVMRSTDCIARSEISIDNRTEWDGTGSLEIDFGDGTTTTDLNAPHQYDQDGVYIIKQIGTREFCVYEKAVSVPVLTIKVPNIITPGSAEGKNDVFLIQYGDDPEKTPGDYGLKVALVIYNRWGKKVFESTDYQYNWSGAGLSSGVYYFDLTLEGYPMCKSWLQVVN